MTRIGRRGEARGANQNETRALAQAGDEHGMRVDAQGPRPDAGAPAASGDEQLVNSFTAGFQGGPHLARGGSGNVAVAWVSSGQDGDTGGVYLRIYAPNGNTVLGETRVNQATAGNQNAPTITALDNGNFVVAWQSHVILNPPPQSTFLDQIYYRIYSPAGTPVTGELTANSAIHKTEGLPSVAALDGGGFAMSWDVQFEDGRREIFVRVFNDAGVPNANEQFANTFQGDTQTDSRSAGLEGGGFIVAWEDRQGAITTVKAQRFANDGSLVGGEFAVQAQPGPTERIDDVIGLAGGGFVILASREIAQSESQFYARIYGADGVAIGGERTIGSTDRQNGGRLTPLADGGFVAVWDDVSQTADVHSRAFDAAGNPLGDEFTVNQTTNLSQGSPDLVERADGSLLYAWSGNGTGDSNGVFLRAFDAPTASGTPITGDDGDNVLVGTPGDDVVQGLGGNDTLNGGAGADRLEGGTGNDRYYVDNAADQVIEASDGGNDIILSAVSYVLADGVFVESLATTNNAGTAAINLTGNNLANSMSGNAGANILNGGAGADVMQGFGGNDRYYVDNALDRVIEVSGGGTDIVLTSVSYVLAESANVESLATTNLAGTGAINLTGNSLANNMSGNAGANLLNGGGGNDAIQALGGNDILNGGAGADAMDGGAGDDRFYIDNVSDRVIEASGGGNDILLASVSYVLAESAFVESLATTDNAGTAAINLTGNSLANIMSGNAGANILNGGGGADIMQGLGGNDRYYVDNALDRVIDASGGGSDLLLASVSYAVSDSVFVEALATTNAAGTGAIDLTGNALDNNITGNAGANSLTGNGGNDSLVGLGGNDILQGGLGNDSLFGGLGADSLTGGAGADLFRFDSALGGGNIDTIADFTVVDDTILLDDAVFGGLPLGALAPGAFVTGSAAADADDRIVYNSATGALLFDADGIGGVAAIQFATLQTGLALTAGDFVVI